MSKDGEIRVGDRFHGIEIGRWYQGVHCPDLWQRAMSAPDGDGKFRVEYVSVHSYPTGLMEGRDSIDDWDGRFTPGTPPWEQPEAEKHEPSPPPPICAPGCTPANVCDRPGCLARAHLDEEAANFGPGPYSGRTVDIALAESRAFAAAREFRQPHAPRYAFAFGRRPWR